MPNSRFDVLSSFLRKRYKLVLVAWIVVLIAFGTQIPTFFGAVNYNIGGSNFGGPTNAESQQAQNILDAQFPSNSNSSNNGIIVVVQNNEMYSSAVQSALIGLNSSVAADPLLSDSFTGMQSLYSTEYSSLESVVPSLLPQVSAANMTIASAAKGTLPANYTWALAASEVANGTAAAFVGSPLFTVNVTSMTSLLASFSAGYSAAEVSSTLSNLILHENYLAYPLILSRSITSNFVSPDNGTMIVVYNFNVAPTDQMIAAFRSDLTASSVPSLGTYYVTGGAVLTSDITKVFGPVVGITVVPGVLASLAIVGILLLAPLAAIVPVLIGGFAIGIALPVIYFGVVDVGHGQLTFLTPTLTILLVLGLAIDYSVLQLRRTREERVKGLSTEESVAISIRWAGQAVLTAGVTVVVAYIVMAVANVPLFSSVGTAIAIAVSILIAAALTLLPSLELLLKDRLFWPGLHRQKKSVRRGKYGRVGILGERTLKRKAVVVVVVAALALGAFYVAVQTPSGDDILKLFPNFASNEGLTVITQNLGSASTGPSIIVVTTTAPILESNGTFNAALMSRLESISATAASISGVVSVSGPTRPYGEPFNYSGVQQLQQPEKAQFLGGMLSYIGKNNETAEIVVGLQSDSQSQAAINTLLKVESAVSKEHTPGVTVYYGGTTQSTYDSQAFLNGILPEVIVVLAAAIYVILLFQLRSAFTPVRLVLTILCSVAFSLALLDLLFFYGLDLPILDFAPLFVVVTMLGVGIDYDIFFVTRIREEALKGKSDHEAIESALDKTWVTILGLGLVLATVFSSLVVTGIGLLQEIGFVVAAAVAIDVGIVILFFVTALMGLAERFNWWPSNLANREIKPEGAEPED